MKQFKHKTLLARASMMLLAMLCFLGGARAQETLTVCDGTATNSCVPIYGLYVDTQGQNSEFIIPAETEGMSDLAGGTISKLTFYITNSPATWGSPTVQVYMGEVEGTTLSSLNGPTNFTTVWTGELSNQNSTMEITLSTPYTYEGGNLLIGMYVQTASSTYKGTSFSGISAPSGSSRYNSGSGSGSAQSFLPKTTFTYTPGELPACPKPKGLKVNYTGGTTAEVSWTGEAETYNIDVNGTVTEGVTSPYTLEDLDMATTYEVKVQAVCSSDEQSEWTNPVSFTTDLCMPEDMCAISITLTDAYGDGGGQIQVVDALTNEVLGTFTNNSAETTYTLAVCDGRAINFVFASTDSWPYENGWVITDVNDEVITEHEGCSSSSDCTAPTNGVIATYTVNCSGCFKPSNLQVSDITTNSATLSWEGTSDSYVLQYRTAAQDINMTMWHQIGEDETATATLDTYTYDLSDYIGSGYVAIRHYNVTNMFRLAIDDIVITDGNGEELFSEDFESGSIPSTLTNQDVDGDGYNWAAIAFDSQVGNGDYVAVSDSWNSNAGPLTPDNWLIIPVSELGGTLTFLARGVDASFPAEVFGVFVTTASLTDALSPVAAGNWSDGITTEEESYQLTDLTANTPYEWQVKGICGTDDESSWTTSTFKTIELGTKNFVTEGNWNVADNWFPAGVPTINDKVIISANATIPAGVVATAKKITLDNATLTIADGGQLKQNGNVEVIMKKEIASYGTGSANWHFIASPLTTTRLTYITDWSYVNALDGNYDLFGFDPTQALEWINYRSSSGHALFTSSNNNPVFVQQTGYLYANEEDMTLQFEGSTAVKSNGNVLSQELTFDDTSSDPFNGWELIGNPYTCNGYISYSGDATFYKMNAAGDGLEAYEDGVELAPGEGAFIKVSASGTITYSSEAPEGFTSTSTTDAETLPLLPLHGLATNQDANILELANEGIEDDELAQYVGGTTNVKLAGRTIVGNGTLNTICLPFDITIAGSPLDGATAYELTETDFTDHTLTLNFTTVDALVAGKPYFIKWASGGGVENPVFRNVTIGAVNATSTNFVETDQLYFQGTYQAVTFDENDKRKLYLGSDNNLYYPAAAGITVNAFRGFFVLNGIDAGDIASQAIVLGDGETTEIISIDNSQLAIDNDAWYTLKGQKIGKKPTTTGVYIHNGRKVIVK